MQTLLSPRRRAALSVAVLVLLAHTLLLGLVPTAPGHGWHSDAVRPLQVRHIVRTAAAAAPTAQEAPAVAPLATPGPATSAVARTPRPASTTPQTEAAPSLEAPPPEPSVPEPGGDAVPVYATRMAPAVTLHYELRRGLAVGSAEMRWRPEGTRYELTMRGVAFGVSLIGWASQGGFDSHGMAPERYAESRRGRELRAANFQRDSGRITFSGPQVEYPLLPGAQDRLSWMLQLAAIVEADPALQAPGGQVSMFVAGSRGDAEVWVFTALAQETLDLPAGTVPAALHLRREPRRAYDQQVEVWLDPARHHLPVRARLLVRATGEGTEFLLKDMNLP